MKCSAALAKLKARVGEVDPTAARKALIVIQMNITDGSSTVATWTVDLKNLKVTEQAYDGTPDVTITVEDGLLADIANKSITIAEAKTQGKVKIEGSPDAMKLLVFLEEKLTG